jgi:hypothetical protein
VGDVHIPPPEPGAIGARVDELIEAGHELYATALTGSPSGRVRRPTLFVIALVGMRAWPVRFRWRPSSAIIAIILLALTDQVVEL